MNPEEEPQEIFRLADCEFTARMRTACFPRGRLDSYPAGDVAESSAVGFQSSDD
jgi:hypothetical protein